jgi:Holliday junction resolvase RusA-like endonuclease
MGKRETFVAFVKKRAKPKARPRVTKNGTFMPADYRAWREEFGWLLKAEKPPHFTGSVELHLGFHTDGVQIVMTELDDATRPKHVRADLDNLIGGVMEILEDVGIVDNDRQVVMVTAFAYETAKSKRERERNG